MQSMGSDIISRLVVRGSDRWKLSLQEVGDGLVLGSVDLVMRHCLAPGQIPEEVSKQDVEVNKVHVVRDDGGR